MACQRLIYLLEKTILTFSFAFVSALISGGLLLLLLLLFFLLLLLLLTFPESALSFFFNWGDLCLGKKRGGSLGKVSKVFCYPLKQPCL